MGGTRWKDSQTKQIYKALPGSEELMAYLEEQLERHNLAEESIDSPVPDRSYGNMVYKYNGRSTLITSAPRKRENYIHVVLTFGGITGSQLIDRRLKPGNGSGRGQDVKLYSKQEIDLLIGLLQEASGRDLPANSVEARDKDDDTLELHLSLIAYSADKQRQNQNRILDQARVNFVVNFRELDLLRNGNITMEEFKKSLNVKAMHKVEGMNIWGFTGFSGQMFFNQLYNQSAYAGVLTDFTDAFLRAVELPAEEEQIEELAKIRLNEFVNSMERIRSKAITEQWLRKNVQI